MSDIQFSIELDDREIRAAISRAIDLLANPTPIFEAIGQRLKTNAELRFDTKTDPTGAAWAPLSPATIEIYQSEWFKKRNPAFVGGIPGTLLERTRQLRLSLAYNAGRDFLDIGTSRATANGRWQIGWLHETGTRRMPRRGFLLANPQTGELGRGDAEDVLDIVATMLGDAFG